MGKSLRDLGKRARALRSRDRRETCATLEIHGSADFSHAEGPADVGGAEGVRESGEGDRGAGLCGGVAGEGAGPGDVAMAGGVEEVAVLRAYLKIERGPSARLLALAGVGSAFTARCGDAQASPPWPPPKSTAAGPLSIFRQTLGEFPGFAGKEFAQGKEILGHIRLALRISRRRLRTFFRASAKVQPMRTDFSARHMGDWS